MELSEKKKLLILISVMVALIGGASLLYAAMKDKLEMPSLVVQEESGTVMESVEANDENADAAGMGVDEESHEAIGQESAPKEPAPDFTVYDVDGNVFKLSDFRGKPVVVNFWASWCGPCKSEMPDFQEIYETYGEEIYFLMVNMTDGAQETVKSASEFVEKSGYTFPVYYDTDLDAAYTYGVYSIPTTYFFDAEGCGVAYGQGVMDKETIMTGIGMLLE